MAAIVPPSDTHSVFRKLIDRLIYSFSVSRSFGSIHKPLWCSPIIEISNVILLSTPFQIVGVIVFGVLIFVIYLRVVIRVWDESHPNKPVNQHGFSLTILRKLYPQTSCTVTLGRKLLCETTPSVVQTQNIPQVTNLVQTFVAPGWEFAKAMETNEVGMAGILSSMTTLGEKELEWNEAMAISKSIIQTHPKIMCNLLIVTERDILTI
mgnify:CR=1 FL=1